MDDLRIESALTAPIDDPGAPGTLDRRSEGASFSKLIGDVLASTNHSVNEAEDRARELAEGRGGLVETILALNKADLTLRFALELRDRFVEAYREITRIQV